MSDSSQEILSAPKPQTPSALLNAHGPTGGLIVRLQRYALLGWAVALLLALLLIGFVVLDKVTPTPVLAVDAGGRVLGSFEYLSPQARSDEEVKSAAKHFLQHYLSLNSETIFEDYTVALNMMCPTLRDEKIEELKRTGYLTQVESAKSRSTLTWSTQKTSITLLARRDLNAAVRLQGGLVMHVGGQAVERPFDITLDLRIIARNTLATHGVAVCGIEDN